MTEHRPNPGSREALARGCICAVLDNCYGKYAPWPPDNWYITEGCPVHDARSSPDDLSAVRDARA